MPQAQLIFRVLKAVMTYAITQGQSLLATLRSLTGVGAKAGKKAAADAPGLFAKVKKFVAGGEKAAISKGDKTTFWQALKTVALWEMGGIALETIFASDPDILKEKEFKEMMDEVRRSLKLEDDYTSSTREVINADSELSLGDDTSFSQYVELREITKWAIRQYGSPRRAIEMHDALRAFLELDDASLARGVKLFGAA